MRAEEERLARIADRTLLVSEAEAALLASRLSARDQCADRGARQRHRLRRLSIRRACRAAPAICSYAGAPSRLHRADGLPAQHRGRATGRAQNLAADPQGPPRRAIPHRRPRADAELRALDGKDGVRVWGEVPAVQPFLAAADLVVAPLTIARGIQNKVLEAMAMARPVLLTPDAATGIGAENGVHLAVERND